MTTIRGRRKVRMGRVVSDQMDKTVVVAVERRMHHPLYGKSLKRVTKFNVHDEGNQYHIGDLVNIVETRPISRTKRWRVLELVSKRDVPEVAPAQAIEAEVEEIVAPTAAIVETSEEPAAEEPTAEAEPTVAETPEEPAAEEPTAEAEPTVAETPEEPAAEEPTAEAEPTVAETSEEPAAEEPTAEAEPAVAETPEEPAAEAEIGEEKKLGARRTKK
jgi:small subunit ribosomal protein S17